MTLPPDRPARVVAELGRPETPEETAARKAEASRKHRSNQSLINLVLALLASLAVVLVLVLVVVRPDQPARQPVDFVGDAAKSQSLVGAPLAAPRLPAGWSANDDGVTTSADGITAWTIGFITPKTQFIGLKQGIDANRTWVSNALERARATGMESFGGLEWTVYDRRAQSDTGNIAYALTTTVGRSSIVLYGTAETAEFRVLATAIAEQLQAEGKTK
ncbi:DUF4245 domain-containing protein [Lacisediminihabitans sp.]|uniref:DUF4245 domain-containing protein n=1 Tax=Lacisediminihabitans sp. TaxID=2787631 RepID=UPI00374DAE77